MPEANVLYGVAGVVVVGLFLWVAFVLTRMKEPWGRTALRAAPAPADPPLVSDEEDDAASADRDSDDGAEATEAGDADTSAKASSAKVSASVKAAEADDAES